MATTSQWLPSYNDLQVTMTTLLEENFKILANTRKLVYNDPQTYNNLSVTPNTQLRHVQPLPLCQKLANKPTRGQHLKTLLSMEYV